MYSARRWALLDYPSCLFSHMNCNLPLVLIISLIVHKQLLRYWQADQGDSLAGKLMPYRHDDLQSIPRNHVTIWVQSHGLALQALGTGDKWTSMAYFSVKLRYLAYLKTLFQIKVGGFWERTPTVILWPPSNCVTTYKSTYIAYIHNCIHKINYLFYKFYKIIKL